MTSAVLRAFASTGEPWNPAPWWWLFEKVGNSKLPIINYSGGTEISGGILMGNPLLPIKPCSFPAPCPGMDVDILDDEGNPVGPGKVGELVIKQPWIGMARGFWQEKERYLDTYWRRFKNIWVHGDLAMRDKDGHWFILGRSDDTLKVAGKRVGPAEVESLLVAHPLVTEAAVIGVPDEEERHRHGRVLRLDECRVTNVTSGRPTCIVLVSRCRTQDPGRKRYGQTPRSFKDPFRLRPPKNPKRQSNAPRHPLGLSRRRSRRSLRTRESESG